MGNCTGSFKRLDLICTTYKLVIMVETSRRCAMRIHILNNRTFFSGDRVLLIYFINGSFGTFPYFLLVRIFDFRDTVFYIVMVVLDS